LSLHSSFANVHDQFMDTVGSWRRAITFLSAACRAGSAVDVHAVITRLNADHIWDLAQFLRAFKIGALRLLRLVPQGRAKLNYDELVLGDPDWDNVRQQIETLRIDQPPFQIKLGAHLPSSLNGHTYECSLDADKLLIEPNGRVSVCPALKGAGRAFDAPSTRSESLVQILTSEWRATTAALKTTPSRDCPAQSIYRALQQADAEREETLVYGQKQARD
jgi:MoaA/NifB/PqqE/SkfB family radical SAM enzyme